MAGGKGTRMNTLSTVLPKPLLPLDGKPILEWEIEALVREGFTDITLVIGHLGAAIREHFGDGSALGATVTYLEEVTPLGTAGALALLRDVITEDFLLLNGDLCFDVDLSRFFAYHKEKGGIATILTHPSTHPQDSVTVEADEEGRALALHFPEVGDRPLIKNRVNAGLHFFSPAVFALFETPTKTDLDREILTSLAKQGSLFVYDSPEYVKDVGTPERLAAAERDLRRGYVQQGNLKRPQRAVFLDRDGTVNRYEGFLQNPDNLTLLPRAAEAIRLLNERHIPVFIVTNQPVIARGEVTREGLSLIHAKLEALLAREGAFINDIVYCPHHPDRGFKGEIPELKIVCDCRKPAPGLLLAAADRYHIDLPRSYMIGDRDTDAEAGRRAGCHTALIGEGDADVTGDSLFACVLQILEREALL